MNPWTLEDEGDHAPIRKEWWTTEFFFTTPEDQHLWNLMTSFAVTHEPPSCFYQHVLFDLTTHKCVLHKDLNDPLTELTTVKNRVDLRYKHNTLQGLYPQYRLRLHDPDAAFSADITLDARALPHWITQETTNGYIPAGLNHYRYGFIPHLTLTGTMTHQGMTRTLTGKGYFEHAYGNWSYENPLQAVSGVPKTLGTYLRLGYWWLSQHHHHLPTKIGFATDNNPMSFDWLWGVFDNDWSFFFGNTLLWLTQGPCFGPLYLTADGRHYLEFCDLHFKYNKVRYIKDHDVYYPSDLELFGRLDDKTLRLRFTSTCESYEYIDLPRRKKFFTAYVLCELPGRIEGTFTDRDHAVPLTGLCKNEPLREAPRHGHSAVRFTFLKPPKGLGLTMEVESHPKKRKTSTTLQLIPPRFSRQHTAINPSSIPRETVLP